MMHSEVYLNKYVVSIVNNNNHQLDQPVIIRITSPTTPTPIQKTALICVFSLFNFSSIFPGGQLTQFLPLCADAHVRR